MHLRDAKSLHGIVTPSAFEVIKYRAFYQCNALMIVEFGEGLEEIGLGVYRGLIGRTDYSYR